MMNGPETRTNDQEKIADTLVRVRGLSVEYRSAWFGGRSIKALQDASFEAGHGDRIGVVGPNGSGKSSLFRALLGVEKIASGSAELFGRAPGDREIRRRIGSSSTAPLPFPELSGLELLMLQGTIKGLSVSEARARAESLLEDLDLGAAARRPHGEYSSGMASRLAFAVAIHEEPELLILDEPTTAMDPLGIERVHEKLDALTSSGTCALVATHGLEDFPGLFTKLLVLLEGRVVAFDDPRALLSGGQTLASLLREAQRSGLRP